MMSRKRTNEMIAGAILIAGLGCQPSLDATTAPELPAEGKYEATCADDPMACSIAAMASFVAQSVFHCAPAEYSNNLQQAINRACGGGQCTQRQICQYLSAGGTIPRDCSAVPDVPYTEDQIRALALDGFLDALPDPASCRGAGSDMPQPGAGGLILYPQPTSPQAQKCREDRATLRQSYRDRRDEVLALLGFGAVHNLDGIGWAEASRAAEAACKARGFPGGFWNGHHAGAFKGLVCLQGSYFQVTGTGIDLNGSTWAQANRTAEAFCRQQGQPFGFFNGHASGDFRGLFCFGGTWLNASGTGISNPDGIHWAQANRAAEALCQQSGQPRGFWNGHTLGDLRGLVCVNGTWFQHVGF